MDKVTVVGIDIGHRNTKYISESDGKKVECARIPSLAPLASSIDLTIGTIHSRNIMRVPVNDQEYQVGADIDLAIPTINSLILNETYSQSPEYLALMKGVLRHADKSTVDLLVTGLPVNQLSAKSKDLSNKMKGIHDLGDGKKVEIKNVLVIAQPVGGLIDFAISNQIYDEVRKSTSLIIDMGFYTLDWVLAHGIQPNAERSGSYEAGMHKFIKNITRQISTDYNTNYTNYSAVDKGLRDGGFRLSGNKVELTKFINNARPVLDEATNEIMNSVGSGHDIDKIIIVGGGATILKPAIEHHYPDHNIYVADASMYANVRGYQYAGEEIMKGND